MDAKLASSLNLCNRYILGFLCLLFFSADKLKSDSFVSNRNNNMNRVFLITGSFSALMAVAAGAFGAHILKKHLDTDMLQVFETAVRYQMYHALALVLTGIIINQNPGRKLTIAGWLFITGTVFFSGSLYILSTTGIKWMGAVTPFGGIAFLGAWLMLAVHFLRK